MYKTLNISKSVQFPNLNIGEKKVAPQQNAYINIIKSFNICLSISNFGINE